MSKPAYDAILKLLVKNSMQINNIRHLVDNELQTVNLAIKQQVMVEHPLIAQMTQHLLNGGGKQLRPLLALLTAKALDYSGTHHIDVAAMIEFFHTATLLHDDVIDESKLRRGQETANEIWGNKASVLVGDYLFTLHTKLLLKIGNFDVLKMMTDIANRIGYGEIKQLINRHHYNLSIEEYFEIIQAKTSLLFAASAAIAGMVAGQPPQNCQALYGYGLHLGNAFQLIDDALDYSSDSKTIGKQIGDDLADGKATLPIIHALKQASEQEKQILQDSLTHGLRENLPQIIEIINRTQSIEFTKQTAHHQAQLAQSQLDFLPPSVYKDALLELAEYCIIRNY